MAWSCANSLMSRRERLRGRERCNARCGIVVVPLELDAEAGADCAVGKVSVSTKGVVIASSGGAVLLRFGSRLPGFALKIATALRSLRPRGGRLIVEPMALLGRVPQKQIQV
jgi:hypothetical protein